MQLTQTQQKRIERLLKVEKGGITAILEYLYDIEDKLDAEIPSVKDVLSRIKGDKGDTYVLTEEDKEEITLTVRELVKDDQIANKVLSLIDIDYNVIAKKASEYIKVPEAEKVDYKKIKQDVLTDIVLPTPENGKDADEDIVADKVVTTLEKNLPQFGEQFRDGLELLQGENRLDVKAIKGIEDYSEVSRLAKASQFLNRGGNGKGLLSQLNDTSVVDPASDDVLKYNSTTGKWENGVLSLSGYVPYTGATSDVTLGEKRMVLTITSVADATSITPNSDTSREVTQINTQATGTLTINAPTGTPIAGQALIFRIKSTNVQTFAWNAIYRMSNGGSLPAITAGGSYTNYYCFMYNFTDTKWDLTGTI